MPRSAGTLSPRVAIAIAAPASAVPTSSCRRVITPSARSGPRRDSGRRSAVIMVGSFTATCSTTEPISSQAMK
jgi:hypothetical protein